MQQNRKTDPKCNKNATTRARLHCTATTHKPHRTTTTTTTVSHPTPPHSCHPIMLLVAVLVCRFTRSSGRLFLVAIPRVDLSSLLRSRRFSIFIITVFVRSKHYQTLRLVAPTRLAALRWLSIRGSNAAAPSLRLVGICTTIYIFRIKSDLGRTRGRVAIGKDMLSSCIGGTVTVRYQYNKQSQPCVSP